MGPRGTLVCVSNEGEIRGAGVDIEGHGPPALLRGGGHGGVVVGVQPEDHRGTNRAQDRCQRHLLARHHLPRLIEPVEHHHVGDEGSEPTWHGPGAAHLSLESCGVHGGKDGADGDRAEAHEAESWVVEAGAFLVSEELRVVGDICSADLVNQLVCPCPGGDGFREPIVIRKLGKQVSPLGFQVVRAPRVGRGESSELPIVPVLGQEAIMELWADLVVGTPMLHRQGARQRARRVVEARVLQRPKGRHSRGPQPRPGRGQESPVHRPDTRLLDHPPVGVPGQGLAGVVGAGGVGWLSEGLGWIEGRVRTLVGRRGLGVRACRVLSITSLYASHGYGATGGKLLLHQLECVGLHHVHVAPAIIGIQPTPRVLEIHVEATAVRKLIAEELATLPSGAHGGASGIGGSFFFRLWNARKGLRGACKITESLPRRRSRTAH
mmetsp:Transcript_53210/g.121618  ORF Transcript_53210/g.121618 Transcript_53210/m.121618 type:complete len:436 (+) Transcript_53210:709-2016(+)